MVVKPLSKPTLLVLAAGLASRYESLKQIDRFGPSGETLIEYAIFDAIRVGFGKVVFTIRRNIENEFRDFFADKFSDRIAVTYAFQEVDAIPSRFPIPAGRQKPWGTGHAILVAARKIEKPFAVINADDFYGADALKMMWNHLTSGEPEYCVAGYPLADTLSQHGPVSRALCATNESGYLKRLTEVKGISRAAGGIVFRNQKGELIGLSGQALVSMNLVGLTPSVFDYLSHYFEEFLHEHAHDSNAEFYLPRAFDKLVKSGAAKVKVLPTASAWFGVTYKRDRVAAVKRIRELTKAGVYPGSLWR
jgi:NDP-sugar pyrophosphorylase family protein